MENFCPKGKLEHKEGYDICREANKMVLPNDLGSFNYDLTLLQPKVSTKGHYHFGNEPELYEVVSGEAQFLMQNSDASQTYIIEAKEKDKIVFPPGFSMRTINPSQTEELLISNWVNDKVQNNYEAFKNIQEPIKLKPKKLPPELENLQFLANSDQYKKLLTIENLFERI
jgi:hypothetical protein